ncbi:MAG: multicopper oxidase domain-containing protein [Hyphomicrobium sp.]|nr:multicopper oxidase domain-containing protein [Hyphomicrobium sp.]
MYIDDGESKRRQREARNARKNRSEIVRARSWGEVTRRDLVRWGIFSSSGWLAAKNGLNPFVKSAFAQVPTGVPRSPLFGAKKFQQELPRLPEILPHPLSPDGFGNAAWPAGMNEPAARRLSYHTEYSLFRDAGEKIPDELVNPLTGKGPIEGRPPGEYFAHQKWNEYFPQQGYLLSLARCARGLRFHPRFPVQDADSVWSFGAGRSARGGLPPLIKLRYGEPVTMRIYNNLPRSKSQNNGFGINQASTHFHNAHNGAESDGASNAYHYPGTFYDYRWGTTLARSDQPQYKAAVRSGPTAKRASGPDGRGGLNLVDGDFRELQGSLWFHDHRFFYTAENVYKGHFGAVNVYSGPDRGNERLFDDVNHRLPSGWVHDYGNVDFDVNLFVHDQAYDDEGQLFFDIFNMDGFLGDVMCVNMAYAPYMNVLPRKYRLRLNNACMSRFVQLALVEVATKKPVPFKFIANDGNFVVNPIELTMLDEQGTGERYDIVVDFSAFPIGAKIQLVNLLKHKNGKKPDERLGIRAALRGDEEDPAVGPFMEFIVSSSVRSVDDPGTILTWSPGDDWSQVPNVLTEQIPIISPVRVREIEFKHDELNRAKDCLPSCEDKDFLPWVIRVDGESTHSLNANRISLLIPKPGETEHWIVSTGGGWDHPVHLHFEEGVTINRGGDPIPATEKLVRKDVWRLRPGGTVRFQVTFGEFGGSYVNHCHNTVHEDFAMLMRYQVLSDDPNSPQFRIIPTPIPSEEGVEYMTPEVLPEAYGRKRST